MAETTRILTVLRRTATTLHDSNRPLDGLLKVLTPAERARAITAVDQIERLGANRGKPLRRQLDALLDR